MEIKDGFNPVKTVKVTVKDVPVKLSVKATGGIDVLRNSSVILKGSFTNYGNEIDGYELLMSVNNAPFEAVYEEHREYFPGGFYTKVDKDASPFEISWYEDGKTWELRARGGLNPTDKYKVIIRAYKYVETEKTMLAESAPVALSVKMGSGKVTADRTAVTLRGMDRFQMEKIKITPTNPTLRVMYVCMTPNHTKT